MIGDNVASVLPQFYGYGPKTLIRIVDCLVIGLNLGRMTRGAPGRLSAHRTGAIWLALLILAATPALSLGLTALPFAAVRQQVVGEIAVLSAIEFRTPEENLRLRLLTRANGVFELGSLSDGRALRRLKNKLRRFPEYTAPLDMVASNLVETFNLEYDFIGGTILPELSSSKDSARAKAQYAKLAPVALRLNTKINAVKTSALYDPAKRRLDNVFFVANQALILPFPDNLDMNSLQADIGGVRIRTSIGQGSDSIFQAVTTETNIAVTVNAIAYPRGIFFSIPDVRAGTFRYDIPVAASLTNRVNIYDPTELNAAATSGAIFISTTPTEVYGSFTCSGPGFVISNGLFRVTLTRP